MGKKKEPVINNRNLRDSSSKLIFGDNILCSQFLRDYADMEILRNIQPEDIEDVSERYVPLYSTERESDTIKKVNISKYLHTKENENSPELPLYIVSLVEHKTKVEYNVTMQILRYMVYIWEDYEKEMNKKYPYISNRKDFRYPPVFPIVYYEGTEKWIASYDLADRILQNTPEYLLSIMEKLLRALLYSMNLEEDEAENAVSKIKERKMGRLFEGVTFNFQTAIAEAAKEAAEEAAKEAAKEATERTEKITRHIAKMIMNNHSDVETKQSLMEKFGLSEEQAEEEYTKMIEYLKE